MRGYGKIYAPENQLANDLTDNKLCLINNINSDVNQEADMQI